MSAIRAGARLGRIPLMCSRVRALSARSRGRSTIHSAAGAPQATQRVSRSMSLRSRQRSSSGARSQLSYRSPQAMAIQGTASHQRAGRSRSSGSRAAQPASRKKVAGTSAKVRLEKRRPSGSMAIKTAASKPHAEAVRAASCQSSRAERRAMRKAGQQIRAPSNTPTLRAPSCGSLPPNHCPQRSSQKCAGAQVVLA